MNGWLNGVTRQNPSAMPRPRDDVGQDRDSIHQEYRRECAKTPLTDTLAAALDLKDFQQAAKLR